MIVLYILFVLASALIDGEDYNNGYRFTDHSSRFLLRALVTFIAANDIYQLFLYASVFYLIFDYALNIICHRPLLYIGQTSKIDKLWKNKYIQLTFKIILVTIAIVLINI